MPNSFPTNGPGIEKAPGNGDGWTSSTDNGSGRSAGIRAGQSRDEAIRPAPTINLRTFLGLLRRQIRLIVATVLVVNGLAALVIFQLTPIYTASTLIMVDPRQKDLLDPEGRVSQFQNDSGRVESEVGILRSPAVLVGVVQALNLTNDPAFRPKGGMKDKLRTLLGGNSATPTAQDVAKATLTNLQRVITISRQGVTYLIEVAVRLPNPERAAQISNAIAQSYIDAQIDAKINVAEAAQRKIASRLASAVVTVRETEQKIDQFVEDNLNAIHTQATLADISAFQKDIEAQEQRRLAMSNMVSDVDQYRRSGNWDQLVASIQSNQLKTLNDRRAAFQTALDQAGADGAQAKNLRAQLDELNSKMDAEALASITQLRTDVDAAQQKEDELKQQRREKIISSLPKDVVVRLYEVQKEADVSRDMYERILNSARAIDVQKDLQVADSRVVSSALPPAGPSFPATRKLFAICGLASLVLGLGLAFLRENFIGGFVDEAQAESVLGVPAISSLPALDQGSGWKAEGKLMADEIIVHPISSYSEAIRRIRLGVDLARRDQHVGAQTILVTSAIPNEGKTLTAISLARAFAASGKKTLLIDCDLRRPHVHKLLGVEGQAEFTKYLAGEIKEDVLADLVTIDPMTGLSLIVGAGGSRSATDALLDSSRLEHVLGLAKQWFDFIIIDSSPLLPVVDARLLLRHATTAIVVVRWAQTSQQEVKAALADLERINYSEVPIFAVLNNVEVGSFGYGYRGRYKSYQVEAAT
jgi:capsular exopolysaccharide synthesis family protein